MRRVQKKTLCKKNTHFLRNKGSLSAARKMTEKMQKRERERERERERKTRTKKQRKQHTHSFSWFSVTFEVDVFI